MKDRRDAVIVIQRAIDEQIEIEANREMIAIG
jgi:hypothetical protein